MIKIITKQDEQFFKMLYCCGVVTNYGLQLMKISNDSITTYKRNNLIDTVYENGQKGYKLTNKSKKIISKLYGLKRSYRYRSINHCSKLQEIYLNLDLERYKWITENEFIDSFGNNINYIYIYPVDAIIVDLETNVLYGIEVVSKSYREKDLEKKEKFLRILGIEAVFIEC